MARSKDDSYGEYRRHDADAAAPAVVEPAPETVPTPEGPQSLPEGEAARLNELRATHQAGGEPLTDAEKAEMDALGLKEAELAGHVVNQTPEADWTRDSDGMMRVDAEIVGILDAIVATVPSLASLAPRLARLTARMREMSAAK